MSYQHRAFLLSSHVRNSARTHVLIVVSPVADRPGLVHVRSHAAPRIGLLRHHSPLSLRQWTDFVAVQRGLAHPNSLVSLAERHIRDFQTNDVVTRDWTRKDRQWVTWKDNATAHLAVVQSNELALSDPVETLDPTCVRITTDASGLGRWAALIEGRGTPLNVGGTTEYRDQLTELYAVIAALEWLPSAHEHIEVETDCHATVHALNAASARNTREPGTPKEELQQRYLQACEQHGQVQVHYAPKTDRNVVAARAMVQSINAALRSELPAVKQPSKPAALRRPNRPKQSAPAQPRAAQPKPAKAPAAVPERTTKPAAPQAHKPKRVRRQNAPPTPLPQPHPLQHLWDSTLQAARLSNAFELVLLSWAIGGALCLMILLLSGVLAMAVILSFYLSLLLTCVALGLRSLGQVQVDAGPTNAPPRRSTS